MVEALGQGKDDPYCLLGACFDELDSDCHSHFLQLLFEYSALEVRSCAFDFP